MSKIRIAAISEPVDDTIPAGHIVLYMDTSDNHVKTKDENNVVFDLTEGVGATATSLLTYANDAAYELVHGSGENGDLYYNTTYHTLRSYTPSGWLNINELANLYDTNLSSLSDGELLVYDSASSKWVNAKVSVANIDFPNDGNVTEGGSVYDVINHTS